MSEVVDSIRSFRSIVESSVSHLIKEMDFMIAWTEEYISTERVDELKYLSDFRALPKEIRLSDMFSMQLQSPAPLRHIKKADDQTIISDQLKESLNWNKIPDRILKNISNTITREDPKKVEFIEKVISSYRVFASSRKDAACMNAVLQYAIIKKKISEWKLYITDFSYGYFEPYSSLTSPESTASDLTEILFFDRYFAGLFMDKMCSYLGTTHLMSYLENIDKYSRDELRKILTSEISAMGQAQIPITEEIIATKKAIDYERFGGYFLPISDFYQNLKSVFYVPCRYWAYDFESFSGHLGDAAAVDITETSRPKWVDPGYREEYMLNKDLFTPEEDAIITGTVQQNPQDGLVQTNSDNSKGTSARLVIPGGQSAGRPKECWMDDKYAKRPGITEKFQKNLKKDVWEPVYKALGVGGAITYPLSLQSERSRNALCASLIFHAAEEAGVARVKYSYNQDESKMIDMEDYCDGLDNARRNEMDEVFTEAQEISGKPIKNIKVKDAGLNQKYGKKGRDDATPQWAKVLPTSFESCLKGIGIDIGHGTPQPYLRMLNRWLPQYNEIARMEKDGKKEEEDLYDAAAKYLLDESCKEDIGATKQKLVKDNYEQLQKQLDALKKQLPEYMGKL